MILITNINNWTKVFPGSWDCYNPITHIWKDYIRYEGARNIQRLYIKNKKQKDNHTYNTTNMKKRKNNINQIKGKLTANRTMIYKADKGNSIIITYQDEYHRKVMNFISNKLYYRKKMTLLKNSKETLEEILTYVN